MLNNLIKYRHCVIIIVLFISVNSSFGSGEWETIPASSTDDFDIKCEYRVSIKPSGKPTITMYANSVTREVLGFLIKPEECVNFCNMYVYRDNVKQLLGTTFNTSHISDVYMLEKRCSK